jgi:hypothetical protein
MLKKLLVALLAANALTGATASYPVFADEAEADACAAQLSRVGQVMFRAVVTHVKPDSDIPALMRERIRPLVVSGRIRRDEAAENAQPVGLCLLLLK